MNSLEEKLERLQAEIGCCRYHESSKEFRQEIIQVFKDGGWVSPEGAKKVQGMVNQMANLANTAIRQPAVIRLAVSEDQKTAEQLMTGKEWLDRFQREFDELSPKATDYQIYKAAQRASGISSEQEE